jgi:hypothetical protein
VIGAHVAPVMRASLPLRGIGVYVPAKDSDIDEQGLCVTIRKDRMGDLLLAMMGDRISNGEEARRPV